MDRGAATEKRSPRIFYGWWIVLAGAILNIIASLTTFAGIGAFFLPVVNEFNASRTQLAGVVSLTRLEASLLGPLEGWLIDHYGPRKMMLLGIAVMGAGFLALSRAPSLFMFGAAFVLLVALGSSMGTGTPASVAVANWFIRRRSLAMGVMSSGFTLGIFLVPVMIWLVSTFGWRTASVIIGLCIWLFGFPLTFVMRHRPEHHGMLPDGDTVVVSAGADVGTAAHIPGEASMPGASGVADGLLEVNFTPLQAIKTPAFWLLGLAFASRTFATGAVNVHQIPYLTDQGFSPAVTGAMISGVGLVGIPSRLLIAWMGDRGDKRTILAICIGLMGVSMFIFASVKGVLEIALFSLFFGVAFGGTGPLMQALQADYFGRFNIGTIGGLISLLILLGTVGGPLYAALAFDLTGDYRWAFTSIGVLDLFGMALVLLAKRPVLKSLS